MKLIRSAAELGKMLFAWWWSLFTPLGFVCWMVGFLIAAVGVSAWYSISPPNTVLSVTEDDGIAYVNDRIVLVIHLDRQRFCPSEIKRWIIQPVEINGVTMEQWFWVGNIPMPPVPVGNDVYSVSLPLPKGVQKGPAFYKSQTDYHCGLFANLLDPAPTQSREVPIVIAAVPD